MRADLRPYGRDAMSCWLGQPCWEVRMTRRKMAILLAIGLFSSPLAARDQSSRPESSSPVPTGVCRGVALYASSDLRAQPIGAGQHLLFFRRSVRLDIEMVGGGGGGGRDRGPRREGGGGERVPRPERADGDNGPAPEFAPAFLTRNDD